MRANAREMTSVSRVSHMRIGIKSPHAVAAHRRNESRAVNAGVDSGTLSSVTPLDRRSIRMRQPRIGGLSNHSYQLILNLCGSRGGIVLVAHCHCGVGGGDAAQCE